MRNQWGDDALSRRSRDVALAAKNDQKLFGYKAHTIVDKIKIAERVSVTPANIDNSHILLTIPNMILYTAMVNSDPIAGILTVQWHGHKKSAITVKNIRSN